MDEQQFLSLYNATARPLHAYLISISGRRDVADDLLQETYFRVLERGVPESDFNHQKRYLYRIATNLAHDRWRRFRDEEWPEGLEPALIHDLDIGIEVRQLMRNLKPRERALLWLAYVEGMTHSEIASVTGLSSLSIRPMLFHLRKKVAGQVASERNTL